MQVKLKSTLANAKGCFRSGETIDETAHGFSRKELKGLVDSGYAEIIKGGYETAAKNPSTETAAITANGSKEEAGTNNQSADNGDETTSNETGGFTLKHVGGGWYDVLDEDGNVFTEKPVKKEEAEALIAG